MFLETVFFLLIGEFWSLWYCFRISGHVTSVTDHTQLINFEEMEKGEGRSGGRGRRGAAFDRYLGERERREEIEMGKERERERETR